jgi:hypothetical protein
MPGGPINGSGDGANGIIIPTTMQIPADVLSYWTSLTCLYDRYWTAEDGIVTLPIALFHVKKISTVISKEVSKKRVILYEPGKELDPQDASDPLREGVMQTIVDNIVRQPKQYNLEIIIPFQPIGRYVAEGVKTVSDMVSGFASLFGPEDSAFIQAWEGSFAAITSVVEAAGKIADLAGKLPGMDGVSYINLNSLEAMADAERTVCMKMWTGYDYKFVTITGFSYEKNPLEDGVFRGTLQLQEVPVMQITKPSSTKPNEINRNWAVAAISAVQGTLVAPLLVITNVKDAAGGGDTGKAMIGNMLGV